MSIQRFHIIFVLLSLSSLLLLSFYIACVLEENINEHVDNSIHSTTVELRQQLHNDFSILDERFANYQNVSLKKLDEVVHYLEEQGDESDLIAISDRINKNVFNGYYEIYVINDNKVVSKSTSLADLGLDYSKYNYISHELDQLKRGGVDYKIMAPVFDENALDMAQNYIARSNLDQWVMIGFVLPFDEYVEHDVKHLQTIFPSIKSLDLFMLTYDHVQHINTIKEEKDVEKLYEKNSHFTKMIMQDLKLSQNNSNSDVETIAGRFAQSNIIPIENIREDQYSVYTVTANSTENDADDFMLIAKMRFDKSHYLSGLNELRNLFYLFVTLVFGFVVVGFFMAYKLFIKKILTIVEEMRRDEPIRLTGYLFSEFAFFVERYNGFVTSWKEQVARLNKITMQDELTKCANRRYFNQKMKEQIDLYERYGQEFSLIMFDIDDFKAINDTYGHSQGDHVLSKMANDVNEQLRVSDMLCRIGGEEFAIILPETNTESAMFVAEKIRKRIERQVYIANETVTISLGVDSYRSDFDFDSFFSTVDAYLYKSKRSGKNCVSSSVSLSS